MASIHPTAVVDPGAELGAGVEVGPYAVIESDTRIGPDCRLGSHVLIKRFTTVGARCRLYHGAVLGEDPQDLKFRDEPSQLLVGENCLVREYVTFHRATGEGNRTVVGSHGLFMAYCHVGHNSRVGDHVLLANYVGVSGHCVIEDYVTVGGMSGLHQYVTVGTTAMIGGMSRVVEDAPPYCITNGNPSRIYGLNVRGLRRRGIVGEAVIALKRAFRLLYRGELNTSQAVERIRESGELTPEVERLVAFEEAIAAGYARRQLDPLAATQAPAGPE